MKHKRYKVDDYSGRYDNRRHKPLGHNSSSFALLIDCVCNGGTGNPAVVYEGRTELCPSGFFYGGRARVLLGNLP